MRGLLGGKPPWRLNSSQEDSSSCSSSRRILELAQARLSWDNLTPVSFHQDPQCQGSVSSERRRSPWLSRDNRQGSRPQCGLTGQSERCYRLPRSRVVHPREQASHPRDRGPSAQSANPDNQNRTRVEDVVDKAGVGYAQWARVKRRKGPARGAVFF